MPKGFGVIWPNPATLARLRAFDRSPTRFAGASPRRLSILGPQHCGDLERCLLFRTADVATRVVYL